MKNTIIVNYIDLKRRKIMSVISAGNLTKRYLIFIIKKGIIKKTEIKNFSRPRFRGIKTITLDE